MVDSAERDLLERCCRGDEAAWDEFDRRYRGLVKAAVIHTLQRSVPRVRHEDVENICQDIFLSLYEGDRRRLRSFEGRCPFGAWLRSVAVRRALNHVRDEKTRGRFGGRSLDAEPLLVPEVPPDQRPSESEREEIRRLEQHLKRLRPREQLALRLHYFDGLPQRGIGALLGISENAVWPLISRARQKLRKALDPP